MKRYHTLAGSVAIVAAFGILTGARAEVEVTAEQLETALAQVNESFNALSEKLTEGDKERKKFGTELGDTKAKINELSGIVGDFQAIMDDLNTKLEMRGSGGEDERVVNPAQTNAFTEFMRSGEDRLKPEVAADLRESVDGDGGFLAPVEWDRTISDKLKLVSPMRQIASVQRVGVRGYSKLVNIRGTASGWVGEEAARPKTDASELREMVASIGEIYAMPAATSRLLQDSEVDLEAWIASEVEIQFAQQEGLAFVAGDGVNKPKGFLTYVTGAANAGDNPMGAIEAVPAASATEITHDETLDLIYALPQLYEAGSRYVGNRQVFGAIRKIRDLNGNSIWQPSGAAGQPSTLNGFPTTEMPDMPDVAANALPLAFGNFQVAYTVIDRTGVSVLRDPYTAKPYVLFYTTKRVGGMCTNTEAVKVLKMAAA